MDRMGRYKAGVTSASHGADEVGKRFPIKLPPWHEKYLIWWAAMKGASKTGLAQNVIQARVEAHEEHIEKMLTDRAKDTGETVEDLKSRLLREAGFSPADVIDTDQD